MNTKSVNYQMILLLLMIGLGGCTSVPMGDVSRDAQLKKFIPPSEKSGIYIYRNETIGAAVTMSVDIDNLQYGKTASKTYLYKEVNPGKHIISSSAENVDSIEINTEKGTLSYIWQEVKMGFFSARTKLSKVSESEGKAGVLESSLAQSR
jgi:hypothetical protein